MTNVIAEASATIQWLSATPALAIPVYQREYRWTQPSCAQLLHDVLTIAAEDPQRTHFIGSILVTPEHSGAVTLVDGQQRVTTIMLMLAAIRVHAVAHTSPVAAAIDSLLLGPDHAPKLRTHERYHHVVTELMTFGRDRMGAADAGTRFTENFVYFHDRLGQNWPQAWDGLQRLEQVTISLQPGASAQQIFESLNSTGARLSDDELIHNYIHMGRTHREQVALERRTWDVMEAAVGGAMRDFWRDYLVLTSTTQPNLSGDFGIYREFRRRYPAPLRDITEDMCSHWKRQAECYGALLRPGLEQDPDVREQLDLLRAFEAAPRPFLLGIYRGYKAGRINKSELVDMLEQVQSLLIRRALVGLSRDIGLAGSLCRQLRRDPQQLPDAILRRTPEDPAVRLALTHSALPLAGYVLRRIQRPSHVEGLQVEHIYPQTPSADWSGGGMPWAELTNDEQARFRTLLNTIGNLTLLEAGLNAGANNRYFDAKAKYYARSEVAETRSLAQRTRWDGSSIEQRTEVLIQRFMRIWKRTSRTPMDEPEELTRVVDLVVTPTSNADPDRFEYVVFRGEVWGDVHTIKALHWRIAQSLDRLDPTRLRGTEYGTHLTMTREPRTSYAGPLDDGVYVYQGWWPAYLLPVVQAWITAFDFDDDVKVKLVEFAAQG